jgi:AraC-like DNA-binding protein
MVSARGVSVALLRPLAELLGRLEEDPEAFLAAVGIDARSAPDTYVSGEDVDRLLDEIATRRGDPAFGLTLARVAVVRPLGLFGHLVWLSGTLRDAITRAIRFYAMVSRRTLISLQERDRVAVVRQERVPNVSRGAILTEFVFASFALRARAATGERFELRAARFSHASAHGSHETYRAVFHAPVSFGAAFDEIELEASQLDLRLSTADPITADALEAKVAALAAAANGRSAFVDRVRRVARDNLAERPSLATIGKELGMSARTLRRLLEQESTSLRAVIDELRRERADELLATGAAVKEIAFMLGFSEASAFSRAYKRWTGRAPKLG